MKVLWCTHSLAGYRKDRNGYNGSGWITSLSEEVKKNCSIEIAIVFFETSERKPSVIDDIKYYPILHRKLKINEKVKFALGNLTSWSRVENEELEFVKKVVDDYRPDVIHVWGTETNMGLITKYTSIPVIIHLQGLMEPYLNSLLPPSYSYKDFLLQSGNSPKAIFRNFLTYRSWQYKADREFRIMSQCKNYFGRTHWDKSYCDLYSHDVTYLYCSEMLRPEFYLAKKWSNKNKENSIFTIISTISPPLYKGADLILKTASCLKKSGIANFKWLIIGTNDIRSIERHTSINAADVNVQVIGVKRANQIVELQQISDIYFHPSYIDNSPNSVCEAQLLGLPVIATNAGGVSSLIENAKTGFLVPTNEPHVAASIIKDIYLGMIDTSIISKQAIEAASIRHNKNQIIDSIINGYNKLICI